MAHFIFKSAIGKLCEIYGTNEQIIKDALEKDGNLLNKLEISLMRITEKLDGYFDEDGDASNVYDEVDNLSNSSNSSNYVEPQDNELYDRNNGILDDYGENNFAILKESAIGKLCEIYGTNEQIIKDALEKDGNLLNKLEISLMRITEKLDGYFDEDGDASNVYDEVDNLSNSSNSSNYVEPQDNELYDRNNGILDDYGENNFAMSYNLRRLQQINYNIGRPL
ncbi:11638_t:CDS:2 [Entrophospora sp. SA101]|nr:11638_t:CDS:2 [Entrophospora sp. SA101]